jgi:hypothetical protein
MRPADDDETDVEHKLADEKEERGVRVALA